VIVSLDLAQRLHQLLEPAMNIANNQQAHTRSGGAREVSAKAGLENRDVSEDLL
jgi:hypothetical protein